MSTNFERRDSITGSIKLSTSRYVGKLKHGFSYLLSSTSYHKRKESVSLLGENTSDTIDADCTSRITDKSFGHPTEAQPGFSRSWIPIAKAGAGGQVDVYFVASRDWLYSDSFRYIKRLNEFKRPDSTFRPITDSTLPSLASGIRVIKLLKNPRRSVVDRHCMKIQGLSDASEFNMLHTVGKDSRYMPRLVDWERFYDHEGPSWTVQEAFNCGTLYEFGHVWSTLYPSPLPTSSDDGTVAKCPLKPWPEALIWHVFIELALAMHYIHCAGIAHCDLVAFNICLHMTAPQPDAFGTTQQPEPHFPRVVPIDFGRARGGQSLASPFCVWDTTRLGDLLHEIVHGIPFSSAASNSAPELPGATSATLPERRAGQRDPVTGLCSCTLDAFTAEKRLSPRGQIVYREAMRYTAPMPSSQMRTESSSVSGRAATTVSAHLKTHKTMDDIVLKLVPQARKARADSYHMLVQDAGPDGGELAKLESILNSIVRRKFPGEELIWNKLQAASKD